MQANLVEIRATGEDGSLCEHIRLAAEPPIRSMPRI
jgi:hypothetical protein